MLMKNALHVPSMSHNLIPLFVMREAEIRVNDGPEIHCEDTGFDLSQIDMELLDKDSSPHPVKEDSQTVHSFGTALGKQQQEQFNKDEDSNDMEDSKTHATPSETADNTLNAGGGNSNE